MDREHWPTAMKARMAEFRMEEITELIRQAALGARKKYFSEEAWDSVVEMRKRFGLWSPTWQARVDLFRAVEAALSAGANVEEGRRFARQWVSLFETDSGGDAGVRAGLLRCWADRRNWSAMVRWREEGLHMMNGERFDRVADFLDQAAKMEAA
jgi:hypothetical protein